MRWEKVATSLHTYDFVVYISVIHLKSDAEFEIVQ